MHKIIIFLAIFFIAESSIATPYSQPTMAVLPFQISPVIQTTNFGELAITRTIVEREFSNELMNFLTKSRKFNMLSRSQIRKVMDEHRLTESDWVDPGQAKKMGKLLVADYIVTGVINRLENNLIRQNIAITGETEPRLVSTLKCQFQVIESATGRQVLADQIIFKLKSNEVRREISATERRDWTYSDYKDLLFSRAASKIGSSILASVYPIKILATGAAGIILNRGKGAGVEVGNICKVVSQGKTIIDIDTGESLGGYERVVGTLEVTSTEAKFSKATILSGSINKGDICRLQADTLSSTAPAYPKANLGW